MRLLMPCNDSVNRISNFNKLKLSKVCKGFYTSRRGLFVYHGLHSIEVHSNL